MDIGEIPSYRVRTGREEKGWSQKKLALESGVKLDVIRRVEQRASWLRPETAALLATALEKSPSWFFSDPDELPKKIISARETAVEELLEIAADKLRSERPKSSPGKGIPKG
jgi:transcriptional regulator with XRE-family HTH domain